MGLLKPDPRDEAQPFIDWLTSEGGYTMACAMPDGFLWVGLKPLMFHWTMHIGQVGDKIGYADRYCYADAGRAVAGYVEWASRDFTGEPTGWRKHPDTDRCRNDDGDPESETIGWPSP